jgi:hypothetical protein
LDFHGTSIRSNGEYQEFMACDSVKEALLAQNTNAHVMMTADVAKTLISNIFPGVEVLVYKKKFKDESGKTHAFVPDGFVAFVPEGRLGKTYFGMTPEELAKMEAKDVDITILPSGVAVAVQTTYDTTMQTTTTVAETLLPSYENMDSVYLLSTGNINDGDDGEIKELTVTSVAGSASGDTKITVSPSLEEGHSYKYKVGNGVNLPAYGAFARNYTTWDGVSDITAATGKQILIIECDSDYLAVKAGIATVTAKA